MIIKFALIIFCQIHYLHYLIISSDETGEVGITIPISWMKKWLCRNFTQEINVEDRLQCHYFPESTLTVTSKEF